MNYVPATLKISNRKIVYKLISNNEGLSRAEISRITGISGATIIKIIDYFVTNGICQEVGLDESVTGVGRKPTVLKFNADFAYTVAVSIEGNYAKVGLFDMKHEEIDVQSYRIDEVDVFLEEKLISIIEDMIVENNMDLSKFIGVGLGLPVIVDGFNKKVKFAPLLKIRRGGDLNKSIEVLTNKIKMPVFLQNDVNVSAYGEYMAYYQTVGKDLLYLSIGTGVGCGIVLGGKIRYGANWSAGEIGNMVFDPNYQVKDTEPGWFEKRVNLSAIKENFSADIEFFLEKNSRQEIIEYMSDYIGLAIANITAFLDIDNIIVGGILVENFGDDLIKQINKKCRQLSDSSYIVREGKCKDPDLVGLTHIVSEELLGTLLQEE